MPRDQDAARAFGAALRLLRERRGRKQYRIAEAAGITKGILSTYEAGRRFPSVPVLLRILDSLDSSLKELGRVLRQLTPSS